MKREIVRFAGAGIAGFFVDAAVLYVCLWLGMGYFAGRAVSFLCAVVTTWLINRTYTFEVRSDRPLILEFLHYLAAMAVGGVVNYAAYSAVVVWAPRNPWTPLLAVAAGVAAGMAINFASARFWVFRQGRGPSAS